MGWFVAPGPSVAADPRACLAAVLACDDGSPVGAGVLIAPGKLLTCAHVVNDALGRAAFDPSPPGPETVDVTLSGRHSTQRINARVAYWVPPRERDVVPGASGGQAHEWLGDLAVLRIESGDAELGQLPMWTPMAAGQSLRAWHSSGLSHSFADVRVKTFDGAIGWMDGEATGMAVGPAYSGSPLWSVTDNAVAGLVAAHTRPPADPVTGAPLPYSGEYVARRSWGIPWQRIERELRAAGAAELFDMPEPDLDDPALPLLADLLGSVMPSPLLRTDHARALADRCGYQHRGDGSAPSVEEFALLLVTEPRALAALSEVLRRREPEAAAQLLAAGRMSPVPRLLSPREHARLEQNLESVPSQVMARLAEIVRAALPLAAALPAGDTPDLLLDELERLPGDSRPVEEGPRVPGLLRVLEYLAALCPATPRARLRLWCDGVAGRLAIPHLALAERRSDAEDWARSLQVRTPPPRVLAEITGTGPGRYTVRLWCDEGAGPRQLPPPAQGAVTGTEVARALLGVLESLHRDPYGEERPMVEALVDRDALNLPIDEWDGIGPDDLVPGVLGAEYPLVVNCPDLLRRNERFLPDWRLRWRRLDIGDTLHFTDAADDRRSVYGRLMEQADAVRVAVDVPPRLRNTIVQMALSVGVPVVLWDRGAERTSHAVAHLTSATTRDLPESVRSYRAKSVHRPREYPGKPVLAWADADRGTPRLHLSEPQEPV